MFNKTYTQHLKVSYEYLNIIIINEKGGKRTSLIELNIFIFTILLKSK